MKFSAILPAAGSGSRTNLKENKVFFSIGGKEMILHSLRSFLYHEKISNIIVAASQHDFTRMQNLLAPYKKCKVILGGKTRSESVFNCLKYCIQHCPTDYVLIHDAARPFLTDTLLNTILKETEQYYSAVPVLEPTDSFIAIKDRQYKENLIRQDIASVQTPQSFSLTKLVTAYQKVFEEIDNGLDITQFTDDSSIYAKIIERPHLIKGDPKNKKITYIDDILTLPHQIQTGIGQDVHRYAQNGDKIILGGVQIPAKAKLIAHSDGDVLIHAIMDALLSAAGLNDIGHYFPDSDEKYKNCNSLKLLEEVFMLLQQKGYFISNLSVSILAEEPKLSPHIAKMKVNIAKILQIDCQKIGISVTTTEKLGAIGRSEGVFVTALATIVTIL